MNWITKYLWIWVLLFGISDFMRVWWWWQTTYLIKKEWSSETLFLFSSISPNRLDLVLLSFFYCARTNMFPIKQACSPEFGTCCHDNSQGKYLHPLCGSRGTSSAPFVCDLLHFTHGRVGDCVCTHFFVPFTPQCLFLAVSCSSTPTRHLVHQMHAGISQLDRLNRWSAFSICVSAKQAEMGLKYGMGGGFLFCK